MHGKLGSKLSTEYGKTTGMNTSFAAGLETRASTTPERAAPALTAGVLSALLGLTVLTGWYTHNETLLHIVPAFVAMAYNTSLGFFLCGLSLTASALPATRPARAVTLVTALFAGLLGMLTLAEYAFHADFGIDQLLMHSYTRAGVTHPGRMAISTALCFALTALPLAAGLARRFARCPALMALAGSLVFTLGMIALSGYFTGVVRSYAWGQLTRMAVHTASGFLVLGAGLVLLAWRDEAAAGRTGRRWLPLFVGIGASAAALCLWQALAVEQGAQMAALRRLEAQDAGMPLPALTAVQDALPKAALLGGLCLAALLSGSVFLAQVARRQAAALQAAQDSLEGRVAARTGELAEANAALHRLAGWQRGFLRDVLASVTEGKLHLCDTVEDLPPRHGSLWGTPLYLHADTGLSALRRRATEAAVAADFSPERIADLITAVNEAGMNAIVHAGAGTVHVSLDADARLVQVWVEDTGSGITMENLPRATLSRGFTTAGTLGHGLKLMLQTTDRLWLLTGPTGTTVVLEQDRTPPPPLWAVP